MSLTEKFDRYKKTNPDEPDSTKPDDSILHFETAGSARNVCFAQPDGKRIFLNYAYLISGEYAPEESTITLTFTTHTVQLTGHNLGSLYEGLMAQTVKHLTSMDKRYEVMKENPEPIVIEVIIMNNKN